MQFGVCGDVKVAGMAARAAYDYAEWTVGEFLKPEESSGAFQAVLDQVRSAELPYPAVNRFIPAHLKIAGEEVDRAALEKYVACAMRRAEQAGVDTIVFGSGDARRVPDGFDIRRAHDQIISFCSMAARAAHDHGVTIVVEPLNKKESNILNTVAECAALVKEMDHPAVRLLVDAYHLLLDNDSYGDIVENGPLIRHVHIATIPQRLAPGSEECDFAPFFNALSAAGYGGRVSIETAEPPPESALPQALRLMAGLAGLGSKEGIIEFL